MKFVSVCLSVLFIIKLWSGSNQNLDEYVLKKYGGEKLKYVRKLIQLEKRLAKVHLDLDFLLKCNAFNIIPKFLRFKLHRKALQSASFYRKWQNELLITEINWKKRTIAKLENETNCCRVDYFRYFSNLDRILMQKFIHGHVENFKQQTSQTHRKEMEALGANPTLDPCDPDKVISNFSRFPLNPRIKQILAYGLDFGLPVYKIDFYKYFTAFENFAHSLKHLAPENFSEFCFDLKAVSRQFYHGFKPREVLSAVISRSDTKLLKNLSMNKEIIVTKPDKGRGVVIVERHQYIRSMKKLIEESSKFVAITEPIDRCIRSIETKINNFLESLRKKHYISPLLYKELYTSGSAPGILYGLPKVHKEDFSTKFQFRPIFAAYNCASYNLSKFLVKILNPISENSYTVRNSSSFVRDITNLAPNSAE